MTCDNSWNYATIIRDKALSKVVRDAFDQLSHKEVALIKGRCAICRNCGRIRPMRERASFEELATAHEYSTTSGAERAYKRAVKKLVGYLVDTQAIGVVELRQIGIHKEIPAVIYEYRPIHKFSNEDDCTGEIKFNLREKTVEILTLAEGDTCNTTLYAQTVIQHIWPLNTEELPKKLMISIKLL